MRLPDWISRVLLVAGAMFLGACSSNGQGADAGSDASDAADGGDHDGVGLCRFDPKIEWTLLGEILQMESGDKNTCVWLRREDQCPPGWICKAHPFKLLAIRIGHNGKLAESDDTDSLSWTSTHHNWQDQAEARIGGVTYRLQGSHFGQAYTITASGAENWGPVELRPFAP